MRPLRSDASVIGVGFGSDAIESIVPGSAAYETWKPATAIPVIGTENCGFPRDGVSESFTGSHVHRDGCRLKSVNHSQAERPVSTKASAQRLRVRTNELALIAYLLRAMTAQQRGGVGVLLRRTLDPHAI